MGVNKTNKTEMNRSENELRYSLVINAPMDLVYDIRSNPRMIPRYLRTKDTKTKSFNADVKVGGKLKLTVQDSRGATYVSNGTFVEVVPKERVKYELEIPVLYGRKISVEEWGEKISDTRTRYNVKISCDCNESLDRVMMTGWDEAWIEYINHFGKIVEAVHKERTVPDLGPAF